MQKLIDDYKTSLAETMERLAAIIAEADDQQQRVAALTRDAKGGMCHLTKAQEGIPSLEANCNKLKKV